MRVILAGYNIDAELIQQMGARGMALDQLTPETLAAAYARISRNPAPVNELRRQARQEVARARASNEKIVFGLGHASVAEHAVFNFDLLGISRLAIEAVEHSRLCSYTEKSQRYITLRDDYVLPIEVSNLGLQNKFKTLVDYQNRTYHELYKKLKERVFLEHKDLAKDKANLHTLSGWAKEDARYVTSLATQGQLGMTINARNLERMIRRLAGHPLEEARELGRTLYDLGTSIAPSLIRYTEPSSAESAAAELLMLKAKDLLGQEDEEGTLPGPAGAVQLVDFTAHGDTMVTASLLHTYSCKPFNECFATAKALSPEEKKQIIAGTLRALSPHDPISRAFELVSFTFDIVCSAACFGQLKRHRMATMVVQPFDPQLGYTIPPAVEEVGMVDAFKQVIYASSELYEKIVPFNPAAASYALTQSHRRRVLISLNARELYHFARLRLDMHAQWDIRQLAERMLYLAKQEMPLTLMMACGKDAYDRTWKNALSDS